MTLDPDTFLVALYTLTDDLYRAHCAPNKPSRPGKRPEMHDSEVLTLAICGQWLYRSERALLRYAAHYWRPLFPRLLSQSAFNRRVRDLAGTLVHLVPLVARALGAHLAPYQVFDTVPVPLLRCCRGRHHRLFGAEAAIGKGGTDRYWYYGCQLLPVVTSAGIITGFVLGPADTEGRWLAEALLCWRDDPTAVIWEPQDLPPSHRRGGSYVGPTGPIWPRDGAGAASPVAYIVDDGFYGSAWQGHWCADYGAKALAPRNYCGGQIGAARRQHCSWRHIVETINEHLTHVFGLAYPGARSRWGLLARVAAKLAALNLGIWINRLFGRDDLAFATLFSC